MNKLLSSSDIKAGFAAMDSTQRRELEQAFGDRGVPEFLNGRFADSTSATLSKDSSRNYTKWANLKAAAIDEEVSDSAFSKILKLQPYKIVSSNSSFTIQKKRSFIANSNLYLTNSLRNLPIMMFVLLPLFALILMVLHLKNKKFYVEHLIHALHLHAFAYFFYGVGIILIFNFEAINGLLFFVSFALVTLYAFISVKRVYKNDFMKAILKFMILGFFYFTLLLTALFMELYVSFLLL
ncbi:hypothetical protein [Marivirga lumbricoides]|uniref:hypothetical protein n=1 Tax=Marivirga lumbricoides TaxID=1046115 RepID=UPI001E5D70DE